jgi:hypothetical protein
MSATNISIRLGVEGKAEIKRAFEEVGKSGQAAFGSVETALDRTGAATDREAARFKRLAEAARLAGDAEASQKRFNTVLGVDRPRPKSARDSAGVFEEAAREAEGFRARANALRAAIDPLGAAQARLNAELAEYASLAKRGSISGAELAAGQALAKQKFDQTAHAIRGVGAATGLTRFQMLTLQYTVNDVIASLSSGASPMTILMQQGGQVTQAFGGVRQTLVAAGRAMFGVGGAIAAVGIAAAIGGAAWYSYDRAAREVQVALDGIGRTTGATVDQLNQMAEASAAAGNLSLSAARVIEIAFLRTGRVGVTEIVRAITITRDFAATMGVEVPAAADQLAKALADPLRGADELNAKLNFLDDKTRQYIKTLLDQNDRTAAQRILLDALIPSLAAAETATTGLGGAWDYVSRAASDAYNSIGRAIDRSTAAPSLIDETKALRDQIARREAAANSGGFDNLFTAFVANNSEPTQVLKNRLAFFEKAIADQEARAKRIAADAKANEISTRAGDVARDATPGFRELERLRVQQAALRSALDDPIARAKLADPKQVEDAYARVTKAIADFKPKTEDAAGSARKLTKSAQISAAAILGLAQAYLQSADAAQRGEAARDALRNKASLPDALGAQVAGQALAGAKQVAELESQAAAQRAVNDAIQAGAVASSRANDALQLEQALRPLTAAETLADANAKGVLATVIDRLRGAYEGLFAEQRRTVAAELIASGNLEIETLSRQIALVGASANEREQVLALLRTEQDLRRRGIDLASAEGQAILGNTAKVQQLTADLARQKAATDALDGAANSAIDRFGDLLAQGKLDWNSWADAGRSALQDITRELIKLAVLNPIKNALFGSNAPTLNNTNGVLSSVFKDIFASVFHEGGTVGAGGGQRRVPALAFAGAPRFHEGAFLKPDEVPAILQRGERVLNRNDARDYDRGKDRQTGGAVVNVTIQTPNPAAFNASRTQIAAGLARAVQSGMRGM